MTPIRLPPALTWLRRWNFPHKLGICERIFGRDLEKAGICWVETAAGIVWKLDLANPTHRWIVFGKYEGREFIDWAARYLRPDATIVDSGANVGQMLLYLARYVPQGKVLAFEPGAKAADWLQECLAMHSELPVKLLRQGLGERSATLYLSQLGPAHSHGSWNQVSATQGESIEVVSLDEALNEQGIPSVDLWKLDVEGYELSALAGAKGLLQGRRIGAIYAELGFGIGQKIVDKLMEFGYRGYRFDRHGGLQRMLGVPEHTNGLFLPADDLPELRRTVTTAS